MSHLQSIKAFEPLKISYKDNLSQVRGTITVEPSFMPGEPILFTARHSFNPRLSIGVYLSIEHAKEIIVALQRGVKAFEDPETPKAS